MSINHKWCILSENTILKTNGKFTIPSYKIPCCEINGRPKNCLIVFKMAFIHVNIITMFQYLFSMNDIIGQTTSIVSQIFLEVCFINENSVIQYKRIVQYFKAYLNATSTSYHINSIVFD